MGKGGGGGGGNNTTTSTGTTYNTNIPEYARPYVETMLGATQKQLFEGTPTGGGGYDITGFKPYTPYSQNPEDYVAPFSPLQERAMTTAASPQAFGREVGGYMSPYMQDVVDVQKREAARASGILGAQNQAQATNAGAFGGYREGLQRAENQRNLMTQMGDIQKQGSQAAYDQATQQARAAQALQMQYGTMAQSQAQQKINQAIQDYANAQQYPLMQLGVMSNMLRGLPMQASTTNQYVAAPNPITQGIGVAGAGASLYNAMKAKGGVIKEMASGGIASVPGYSVGGNVKAQLESMPVEELQKQASSSSSPTVRAMAKEILAERQATQNEAAKGVAPTGPMGVQYEAPPVQSAAQGGILAFTAGGDKGKQIQSTYDVYDDPEVKATTSGFMGASQSGDQKSIDAYRAKMENAVTNAQARAAAAQGASNPENYSNEGRNPPVAREIEPTEGGLLANPPRTGFIPSVVEPVGRGIKAVGQGISQAVARPLPASFAPKSEDDGYTPVGAGYERKPYTPTKPQLQTAANAPERTPAQLVEQARLAAIHAAQQKGTPAAGAPAPAGSPAGAPAQDRSGIKAVGGPRAPAPAGAPAGAPAPAVSQAGVESDYDRLMKDSTKSIKDIMAEQEAAYRAAGIEPENKAAQDQRAKLMAERANTEDEARRTRNMRLAEFFSRWGSTPGPTLAAGLAAMQKSIPDFISDRKEQKKTERELDKLINDIDQSIRLEKKGKVDEAVKIKQEAAKVGMHLAMTKLTADSHITSAKIHERGQLGAAAIREKGDTARADAASRKMDEQELNNLRVAHRTVASKLADVQNDIAGEKNKDQQYRTDKLMIASIKKDTPPEKLSKAQRDAIESVKQKEELWTNRENAAKDDVTFYKGLLDKRMAGNKQGNEPDNKAAPSGKKSKPIGSYDK